MRVQPRGPLEQVECSECTRRPLSACVLRKCWAFTGSVQPLPLGLLRPDSGLERVKTRPTCVHSALPGAAYAEGHLRGPSVISLRQHFLLFPQRVAGWKAAADPEPAVSRALAFSRGPSELQLLGAGPGPRSGGQKGPSIQAQLTTPAVFSVTYTGTKGPL